MLLGELEYVPNKLGTALVHYVFFPFFETLVHVKCTMTLMFLQLATSGLSVASQVALGAPDTT